ncbi:hypothetical protein [Clostridium frigidicarnis]|uniref:2'-5' RNA ligase n=1 Tax=Clostridium frigidicarnis TaxID=84698 RepID=A0A1I1AQ71_9CLOT|nr:hypothetical protein [Clostridium frigidicarnis]SFB39632.1 hypothetical protein SAMN04488528_10426 [Clostridium frigidicarnis]
MKYYLVALIDDNSYKMLEPVQKNLCRKYRLSRNIPTLHIPLQVIDNPNLDKLDNILSDILKPYKRFKIEINDEIFFYDPIKTFNLKIESKGYIKRLSRLFYTSLKLNGFNVKMPINENEMFIYLTNFNNFNKDTNQSYNAKTFLNRNMDLLKIAKVDRIELWKSTNGRKDNIILSYPLKTF